LERQNAKTPEFWAKKNFSLNGKSQNQTEKETLTPAARAGFFCFAAKRQSMGGGSFRFYPGYFITGGQPCQRITKPKAAPAWPGFLWFFHSGRIDFA